MSKPSPALTFVRHLYEHAMQATGHSWTRLNGCLCRAVSIAIEAGLPFADNDIAYMNSTMKGGYWFLYDAPERWYAEAIKHSNRSAWKSLEKYLGRDPFLFNRDRLHVGYQMTWQGQQAVVTSFAADNSHLIACVSEYHEGRGMKVIRRFKITRDQLKAKVKEGAA